MPLNLDIFGLARFKYPCYSDICIEGIQFCNKLSERCADCSAYEQDCFTNVQQQNCTKYCMELWQEAYKSQKVQTETNHTLAIFGGCILFLQVVTIILFFKHRIQRGLCSMWDSMSNKVLRSRAAAAGGQRRDGEGIEDTSGQRSLPAASPRRSSVIYNSLPTEPEHDRQYIQRIPNPTHPVSPVHNGDGSPNQHGIGVGETTPASVYNNGPGPREAIDVGGNQVGHQHVSGDRAGPSGKSDWKGAKVSEDSTFPKTVTSTDRLDVNSFYSDSRTQSPNGLTQVTRAYSLTNGHLPHTERRKGRRDVSQRLDIGVRSELKSCN